MVLKDRPGRQRRLPLAATAVQQPPRCLPRLASPAAEWTYEPARPPQTPDVAPTYGIGTKPLVNFLKRPGIINSRHKPGCIFHTPRQYAKTHWSKGDTPFVQKPWLPVPAPVRSLCTAAARRHTSMSAARPLSGVKDAGAPAQQDGIFLVHRFHETNLLQGDSIRGAGFPDAVASHPISGTGGCDGGSSEGGRTTHCGEGVGRASVDLPFADGAGEPGGARPDPAALSG